MSMQTETYIITDSNLQQLLQSLVTSGRKVVAPVRSNSKVLFKEIETASEVCSDHIQTAFSAKHLAFPRTEVLFRYKKTGKEVNLENFAFGQIPDTILWGCRPCDAAGFEPLDGIFNWDSKDAIYNKRREYLTIVSFSCTKHDDACFCTSVGGDPGSTKGCDVLITPLDKGSNLAEIITEKGKVLRDQYSGLFEKAAGNESKEHYIAKLEKVFDAAEIRKRVEAFFESDIWKKQSARCLGCGACAYVCPACACFDIQDDKHGSKGSRLRCWDSCGFSLFTLHTSGHNPRETQARRWRQRLMHKFSYMPERIHVVGCSGCGRCSRACPADMNLLEHLTSLTN